MVSPRFVFALSFVLLSQACTQAPAPTGSCSGKCDDAATPGDEIPSPHVDPSKSYLRDRDIGTLHLVGAMDEATEFALYRIDDLSAGAEDGRIEIDELLGAESDAVWDVLTPEEQDAVIAAWPLLEAPEQALPAPLDAEPPLVEDITADPTPPKLAPARPISGLPAAVQSTATELQQLANADNKASTISPADIDWARAHSDQFTTAELGELGQVYDMFLRDALASVPTATVVVPMTSPDVPEQGTVAGVELSRVSTVFINEQRLFQTRTSPFTAESWQAEMTISRTTELRARTVDSQDKAVLVDVTAGRDHQITSTSTSLPSTAGGTHVLEIWRAGQRVKSGWVEMPRHDDGEAEEIDATPYVDHEIVTPAKTRLHRENAGCFTEGNGSFAVTTSLHHHVLQLQTPPTACDTDTPELLRSGVYSFDVGTMDGTNVGKLELRLYRTGVGFIQLLGKNRRLLHDVSATAPPVSGKRFSAEVAAPEDRIVVVALSPYDPELTVTLLPSDHSKVLDEVVIPVPPLP